MAGGSTACSGTQETGDMAWGVPGASGGRDGCVLSGRGCCGSFDWRPGVLELGGVMVAGFI